MIGRIVLAVRASPDWARMAEDYSAGRRIDPARYMPADNPHFPLDMPLHIERWNSLSRISFFACRERLREIAEGNLTTVKGVARARAEEVPSLLDQGDDALSLLFYHDDDDWFHPQMAEVLRSLDCDLEAIDALVLPFFRLATNLVTFTHDGAGVEAALGPCRPFRYRYCTNNYGLTRRALAAAAPAALVEHIGASEAAEEMGFVDAHHDVVISATSKTPCSAGWVRELPGDPQVFRNYVGDYVRAVEDICASSRHEWINAPLRETRDLFLQVLG